MSEPSARRWVTAECGRMLVVRHLDGVPWDQARVPAVGHRCRAQTVILDCDGVRYRCACGASGARGTASGRMRWVPRNSRAAGT